MRTTLAILALAPFVSLTQLACGDDATGSKPDASADTATGDTADATDTRADTTADSTGADTRAPCDPVMQTGCDAGQNCTFLGAETTATCIKEGPVPANMACTPEQRCQRGVCLSINQTADLCYQVCNEDNDCGAGTANVCLTLNGTPYKVCKIAGIYEQCNLLGQNCSDDAKSCYAVSNEPEPICLATGTGAADSECSSPNACVEGYACVSGVCRQLCDPDVATSCGTSAKCQDFFDDTGYCAPN